MTEGFPVPWHQYMDRVATAYPLYCNGLSVRVQRLIRYVAMDYPLGSNGPLNEVVKENNSILIEEYSDKIVSLQRYGGQMGSLDAL